MAKDKVNNSQKALASDTNAEEQLKIDSAIFKNLAEGIYLIGFDDLIIKWTNPVFDKLFGYGQGELIGKKVDIVNAPTDKTPTEIRVSIVDILKKTGEWHGEVKNIKKDGTPFWCYANASLFDHPEYGKVIVSVHTDITQRKRADEEKNKNLLELERMNQLMLGRELKMVELKERIADLESKLKAEK